MARKKKEKVINEVVEPNASVINEVIAPQMEAVSEVQVEAPVKKRGKKPKKTEEQEVFDKVMDIASKAPGSITPDEIEMKLLEDKLVEEQQKGADAQFAEVAIKLLAQGRPESNVINILSAQDPSNRENIVKYIKEIGKKRYGTSDFSGV